MRARERRGACGCVWVIGKASGHARARAAGRPARCFFDLPSFLSFRSLYRSDSARLWLPPTTLTPDALVAAALAPGGPAGLADIAAALAGDQQQQQAPKGGGPQAAGMTVRAALVANPTVRFGTAPCGAGPATRVFITARGGGGGAIPVSPWHDVPLKAGGGGAPPPTDAAQAHPPPPSLFNFVVEVPAGTTPKLEVATGEGPLNPLVQDKTKAGAPRFFSAPLFFNYGMLPRTFEAPDALDPETGAPGDGDPVDVVEVGGWLDAAMGETCQSPPAAAAGALPVGAVVPVKVLGALALIDSGELDWKVLAVRADHPAAASLFSVSDLEAVAGPACIGRLVDWFTHYKAGEGKPPNGWGRGAAPTSAAEAVAVIEGAAAAYEKAGLGPPSVAAPPGLLVVRTRSRVVVPGGGGGA